LAVLLMLPVRTLATTIDEVQNRQEELKQENEDLQAKIDALKEDEEAALAYQEELTGKIDENEQKIDQARATIEEMNGKIKELEARLSLSEEKYQGTIDAFKERLKALYVSGGSSLGTLEILLDSSSLSEFFTRQELVEVMAQRDQSMLDQLDAYMAETQSDREELVVAQQEVADSKKAIEAAQDELEVLYEENDLLVASLEGQQAQAQEQIAANEAEDAELQAQLEALIAERNRQEEEKRQQALQNQQVQNGGSDGGEGATQPSGGTGVEPVTPGLQSGFSPIWPLPGVGVGSITGHFGDMYFNGPHNGLDIGAGYGTPIVAAQAGEVISAQYHWSWGNNVLIWHNETFSTRYAHMSSIAVSAGQYVEQGQIIGYVGSTGESFGNHLHFEVYYGGSRVDPDPYLGI
ncbi:MAG TPA: peptidoglycan DD-metalloendopeptidase family protein, partial [Candidatus Acutalibacter stercoravium]|nr:peptidoglycan DD-metalloendopeptidase family protein [Candidatus Acutalibacter stercoravium]